MSKAQDVTFSSRNDHQLCPPCTEPQNGGSHEKIGERSAGIPGIAYSVALGSGKEMRKGQLSVLLCTTLGGRNLEVLYAGGISSNA